MRITCTVLICDTCGKIERYNFATNNPDWLHERYEDKDAKGHVWNVRDLHFCSITCQQNYQNPRTVVIEP